MGLQASIAVRNAMLDQIEVVAGPGAKIVLYSGAPPASAGAAASGTKLAQFNLASDWAAQAAAGVKALNGVPFSALGLAAGKAGYFRLTESDGVTCHLQGVVVKAGVAGGEMTIDNDDIGQDQQVQVLSFGVLASMA